MFTIMAKNEVKYRPATMAEIENRDTNLFMNGEQVWVLMIHRSEIIGEGEAKLDYIMLTNMKKVQVEDLQVIDNGAPESESEEVSPMMRQYNDMKKQKPDSLLLFRCGDFYETYQEDAKECAKILGITLTKREGGYDMAGFPHHALDAYLPKLIRAGKRVAICDQLPDPPKKPAKRGITELVTNNSELTTKNSETMKLNMNANESGNVQNAQVNNSMAIRTEADVTEAQDIMPVVTPSAKAKSAPKVKTNLKPVNVKPETRNQKPETKKQAAPASLPTLTLSVYTTKRGEQAPRIDGFGGEEDPRWKKHYDEKMRLSKEKEQAKKKNEKIRQQMKGKSSAQKEALLKKIIHVGSDPFGASYFTDRTNGEKSYYFCMGAKYMDVAQQLVDAYNSGDEQAIAQAEQAVIDCKSGIVAEIEASRNSNGDEPETCNVKPETKVYTAAEVADLIQRIANSDPKALAEYDALTKKAA